MSARSGQGSGQGSARENQLLDRILDEEDLEKCLEAVQSRHHQKLHNEWERQRDHLASRLTFSLTSPQQNQWFSPLAPRDSPDPFFVKRTSLDNRRLHKKAQRQKHQQKLWPNKGAITPTSLWHSMQLQEDSVSQGSTYACLERQYIKTQTPEQPRSYSKTTLSTKMKHQKGANSRRRGSPKKKSARQQARAIQSLSLGHSAQHSPLSTPTLTLSPVRNSKIRTSSSKSDGWQSPLLHGWRGQGQRECAWE